MKRMSSKTFVVMAAAGVFAASVTVAAASAGATARTQHATKHSTSASGAFGTLGTVCSPGKATGATGVGVKAHSIRVATIADIDVPGAPGLLQPIWDSATAFVDWCNANGGILGRKLVLDKRDSAETDYLPQVEASCPVDFAIVASMGILDNTGVKAWEQCGIPNITASTVSELAANAKLMYPMNPLPADQENIGNFILLWQKYPGIQDHVGALYAEGAAGAREEHTYNEAIRADGGKVVYTAEYNPYGQVDWAPYITAMRKAGVQFLFLNDTEQTSVSIDEAMATAGWYPKIQISPPQLYTTQFLQTGASVAKNYYVYMAAEPLQAASAIPAVAQYEHIVHTYVPTAQLGFFGEMAFSGWLYFAEAAKACGSGLSRGCLEKQFAKITDWTGGGLQGVINPASNRASQCFLLMKVEGQKFVQVVPSKLGTFYCSPKNVPVIKP